MALSPMMQHYLSIKEKHPDCLVFYRLGDFYEMFFDDAIKASKLLDLTLTGRDCGLQERAPMCGIPYHAAETYIAKAVELGEKIAICEQLSEPNAKGLVERDVIRIITGGTLTEDSLIDEKKNNFIACIYGENNLFSLAWADITTGEFFIEHLNGEKSLNLLCDKLIALNPAEIVCNNYVYEISKELPIVIHGVTVRFSPITEYYFDRSSAEQILKEQLNVITLDGFGLTDKYLINPSGALLSYLKDTQKHILYNILSVRIIDFNNYMKLDSSAIRNLELIKTMKDGKRYGSLLWLLDKTKTGMGARTLNSWILNPLINENKINSRLDGVEELYNNSLLRQSISELLKGVKDIARLSGKAANGNITPRDCLALRDSLAVLPTIKFKLSVTNAFIFNKLNNDIDAMNDVYRLLSAAINEDLPANTKDGGYIKEGYDKQLDDYRNLLQNSKVLIAKMEAEEREKTGIKGLRITYNRVFGYNIEVTKSYINLVPENYIRRQTLANAERYVTPELKELENGILNSEENSIKLETKLFNEIKEILLNNLAIFNRTAKALGVLDVLVAFATVSRDFGYTKPTILPAGRPLNIVGGKHPVVLAVSKEQFIANDTYLDSGDSRTMILTGPNMAGKSTYMRQVALIALLAHIGCFVPAKSAEIPIIDKIFTRVGASDNLIFDQSTFMVEMTELAYILLNATCNSLIILDEIGRGTSTYDGLSIAWAVIEYITEQLGAKTLFATHYHELTELEGKMDGVKNYKVTVKEFNNTVIFLRKIMRGGANKSFGIEVASMSGVPEVITNRAKQLLKGLERTNKNSQKPSFESDEIKQTQVERIINDLNINNLTPMQAFQILTDLHEKIKGNQND